MHDSLRFRNSFYKTGRGHETFRRWVNGRSRMARGEADVAACLRMPMLRWPLMPKGNQQHEVGEGEALPLR